MLLEARADAAAAALGVGADMVIGLVRDEMRCDQQCRNYDASVIATVNLKSV